MRQAVTAAAATGLREGGAGGRQYSDQPLGVAAPVPSDSKPALVSVLAAAADWRAGR